MSPIVSPTTLPPPLLPMLPPGAQLPPDKLALSIAGVLAAQATGADYNNAAHALVSTVLGEAPEVGGLLSALVDIFWPESGADIWSQIEAKVEALINQKIAEEVSQQVSDSLAGLRIVLEDYIFAAMNFQRDPTFISEKFNVTQGHFLHDLPQFQSQGYELLLLPLFAQFANLHLGLLRDGVAFGAQWGWSPEIIAHIGSQLADAITSYGSYADTTYAAGLTQIIFSASNNPAKTESFNTVNGFVRQMTLTVLDFRQLWQYFDSSKYPNRPQIYLDREIYSDAVGTADDSVFVLPAKPPSSPPLRATVWAWDRIDAIQVDYAQAGGPDGRDSTGRMGDTNGGSNALPHGGSFDLTQNSVTLVRARTGDILNALWFQFKDGSWTNQLGGNYPGGSDNDFSYAGEILSSIKVMGVSRFYGSADCAVFGFKFEKNAQPPAELLQRLYRTAPQALSATALAQRLGASETTVRDVAVWAEQSQWAAARQHYWDQLAARVQSRGGSANGSQ